MDLINEETLHNAGFSNTSPEDYLPQKIVLRDGRNGIVWVNKKTGHGILDDQFWETQDYYAEDYRRDFGATIEERISPSEHQAIYHCLNAKQFELFAFDLTRETKFLEIGCSFGGIINKVTDAGVLVCHGVEPNKADVEFLESYNDKVTIFKSTFEDAELPYQYYDMIVGFEVLEHVVSPRFFLKKCFDILNNNGRIYLEVPNHDDVLLSTYRNLGYQKFYYHKAHIHYFTKESLVLLCRECGFEGKVTSFLMYPFFNHIWWYQNHKPQSSVAVALSTPLPTDGRTNAGKAINDFYKKVEKEYEILINANMLGDCLVFQGAKKE